MGVVRRVLRYEWSPNCITVDIMLSFNIVTFVNSFHFKTLYRPILSCGTARLQLNTWQAGGIFFFLLQGFFLCAVMVHHY